MNPTDSTWTGAISYDLVAIFIYLLIGYSEHRCFQIKPLLIRLTSKITYFVKLDGKSIVLPQNPKGPKDSYGGVDWFFDCSSEGVTLTFRVGVINQKIWEYFKYDIVGLVHLLLLYKEEWTLSDILKYSRQTQWGILLFMNRFLDGHFQERNRHL